MIRVLEMSLRTSKQRVETGSHQLKRTSEFSKKSHIVTKNVTPLRLFSAFFRSRKEVRRNFILPL